MLSKEQKTKLDRGLKDYASSLNVPGLALVISKGKDRVYEYYHGYRDVENRLPVTGETVFGLASITKSFASLAIMQLAERGLLSVHDPVQKWIPNFKLPGGRASGEVQIHHLMTHSAGLPGLPTVHQARLGSLLQDPDGRELFGDDSLFDKKQISSVEELVEELAKEEVELLGEPGEIFNYSNESYALLQKIIEVTSGRDFLDYMEENIFLALQMERSSFLSEDLEDLEPVTEIYAYRDGEYFPSPTWWDVGQIYTNGSLKASAYDLAKYGQMLAQGGQGILSEESLALMTKPHIETPNGVSYGYGFTVDEGEGLSSFGHGGGIKGVSSYLLVVPEQEISIVVLINIAEAPAENVARIALRKVLDLAEPEVEYESVQLSKEELAIYAGEYASKEGQTASIRQGKSYIKLVAGNLTIKLQSIGNHHFLTPEGKRITFIVENGLVKGIFRGLRYIEKLG